MYQEMDETIVLLLPVLIPIAAGVLLLTVKRLRNSRKTMISLRQWHGEAGLRSGN